MISTTLAPGRPANGTALHLLTRSLPYGRSLVCIFFL